MVDEHANETQKQKGLPLKEYYLRNKLTNFWNWMFPREKMPTISRQGEHEVTHLRAKYYNSLLAKNKGMIQHLTLDIEGKWKLVEKSIYGVDYKYEKDNYGSIIADKRRRTGYFRDQKLTLEESELFLTFGTVKIQSDTIEGVTLKKIIPNGRAVLLPDLGYEEIFALGTSNFNEISKLVSGLSEGISMAIGHAGSGFDTTLRGSLTNMTKILSDSLSEINKLEKEHGQELSQINATLGELKDESTSGTFKNRPPADDIRFPHTYNVIKQKAIVGNSRREMKFKDLYRDFNRTDEIDPGLDENGYPLEVFEYPEHSEKYYVLVDKWWEEIGINPWQEATIKGKQCGEKKWNDKVGLVRANPGRYCRRLTIGGIDYNTVRRVPKAFVEDLDPMEKLCFMSNEWDAYRDDYRDGRWHRHSKTSMCYILERKATPQDPINFDIDTKSIHVRVHFRPIYYTKANFPNWDRMSNEEKEAAEKLIGTINPDGGMGRITIRNIPNDERQVSRIYNMETNFRTLTHQVRKPSHLNPSFDRAALMHDFIHWGRMFYYEGVEGINKWSENPFPHVTSRGIGKYIIDLVLRSTFSYNDARNLLKGEPGFDYGIRHYDPPFTYDPLGPAEGPGGSLYHGRVKAEEGGGGHS